VIALGNTRKREHVPLLERLSHDEDPVVAEHARWAVSKIADGD
jgi:epoxyqueuosine reductase